MRSSEQHEFALYYSSLSQDLALVNKSGLQSISINLNIKDQLLLRRIGTVLRLRIGDSLVLFDRFISIQGLITQISSREACLTIQTSQAITRLAPTIVLGLPVLKQADLEQALYSAVELGATEIQLLQTAKSSVFRRNDTEGSRIERIMIAAAEQSKNFALPKINSPLLLADWCAFISNSQSKTKMGSGPSVTRIALDVAGSSLRSIITSVLSPNSEKLILVVGPEGDFIDSERQLLKEAGFAFCALTPTVMRAHQAVTVGLGVFRSLLRQ